MVVRVESPQLRPGAKGSAHYPGLTPEERGAVPDRPPGEEAEPLWVLPSDVPPSARPVGFVGPLPEPLDVAPPQVDPEGLFDVPGLLERLWLARALEAHRERPPDVPSEARSGAVASPPPAPVPVSAPLTPLADLPKPPSDATLSSDGSQTPSRPSSWLRPRSWVCPYCYLANDEGASTCRGCRSSSLHL
jgi:hypothetical protein